MTRFVFALALLTGCASQAPVAIEQGEGSVATGTISAPSPVSTPARAPERKASRSRVQTQRATGKRLSVTCYAWTGHRTASGKWPRVGMAAGPWPFGTRLHVEGVGIVTVEDRYGHSTQLDLFGPSEAYCRQFGRQRLLVEEVR